VYREEDAPALLAAVDEGREDLAVWLPWATRSHRDEEESRGWIRAVARQQGFAHPEGFHLGLFDAGSPRAVLGGAGFVHIEAERLEAEVGYWLRGSSRGAGRCTHAVGRLITSAFADWGFRRVVVGCVGANAASRRVAERLGLRRERTEIGARWHDAFGWCDHLGFAVLAEEWDAARHRGPAV
jgi:RimJ/RimL family protein N-acetyltransferase